MTRKLIIIYGQESVLWSPIYHVTTFCVAHMCRFMTFHIHSKQTSCYDVIHNRQRLSPQIIARFSWQLTMTSYTGVVHLLSFILVYRGLNRSRSIYRVPAERYTVTLYPFIFTGLVFGSPIKMCQAHLIIQSPNCFINMINR